MKNKEHYSNISGLLIKEMVLYNFALIFFMLLVNSIQSMDIYLRLKAIIPLFLLLLLALVKNKARFALHYVFPFLKELYAYRLDKGLYTSTKSKVVDILIIFTLIIGLIYMIVDPFPVSFSIYSIISCLVGLNIGICIRNYYLNHM